MNKELCKSNLTVDQKINARMKAYTQLYFYNVLHDGDYKDILWNIMPKNLKFNGWTNTAYDFTK